MVPMDKEQVKELVGSLAVLCSFPSSQISDNRYLQLEQEQIWELIRRNPHKHPHSAEHTTFLGGIVYDYCTDTPNSTTVFQLSIR